MSGLKGNTQNLRAINKKLQAMPKVLAEKLAKKAAGTLTELVQGTYGKKSVYGDAIHLEAGNNLVKTGSVKSALRFVAVGTIVRAALNQKYARYLIGKYGILPNGNAAMPVSWTKALKQEAKRLFETEKEKLSV